MHAGLNRAKLARLVFSRCGSCRFRWRPIREARGFADELHTAADTELGKQRGDMEFDGAFREIQVSGDFLIGIAAKDATENFFFAARNFDFALNGSASLKKGVRALEQANRMALLGLNHDRVVFRRLATDHAVHSEQAGGLFHRQMTITISGYFKMCNPRLLLIKEKGLRNLRRLCCN